MIDKTSLLLPSFLKRFISIAVLAAALSFLAASVTKFTVTGAFEGVFLLKGADGCWFELKDDIFLNEEGRYLIGFDYDQGRKWLSRVFGTSSRREPSLTFEWNESPGNGYVRNHLPGGKQLLTVFSRFVDDDGRRPSGLFVGGGLPLNVRDRDLRRMNETGMAYYDGTRWYHIWCNVNEALFSTASFEPVAPSSWEYLGSRVLIRDADELLIKSSHEAMIGGAPLRVDRYAHFRAGEPYFILSVVVENRGPKPVTYTYQYGDEPWLGHYGSAVGNVGWAFDGLHDYAGKLQGKQYRYAGFFDFGNDAIDEPHEYTGLANFIEWSPREKPEVYFTNGPKDVPDNRKEKTPLFSNTRFLGLLWGPRSLQPGEFAAYTMAIGMAGRDPGSGVPVKPAVSFDPFP